MNLTEMWKPFLFGNGLCLKNNAKWNFRQYKKKDIVENPDYLVFLNYALCSFVLMS